MSLTADFRLDQRALRVAQRALASIPGGLAKAAERAINRTLTRSRTRWAKEIAGTYRVTQKQARAALAVRRASAGRLSGEVVGKGKRMELIHFARQRKPWSQYQRKPRVGAIVQVKRHGFRGNVKGAFVERGRKTGKLHVMWRVREGGRLVGRKPLHILYGPSMTEMAAYTAPGITPELSRYFQRRFIHEVRHLVRRGKIDKYQGGRP